MASSYPSSLDSFDTIASDKKTSDSVGGRTHRDMHNDLGDAIEAVQGELGTTPSGSYDTVKARFEAIEGSTLPQVDAKGDLIVGTADNTYDNLGVGTNDTVLLAASGETKGVKWAQVPTAAIQDGAVTAAKIADGTITSTDVAAGTFASFATVGNLLTANQASIETDTAGWDSDGATSVARSTAQAYHGSASLLITSPANGYGVRSPVGVSGIPVVAGETYTVTAACKSASRTQQVSIIWYTAAGSYIQENFTATAAAPTSWTLLSLSMVAPATAAYVAVSMRPAESGSEGDTAYWDSVGFWKGAGGVWQMPGVPIHGQSSIATNDAVNLSGTGTPEGVITAAPGSTWLQTDSTVDVKGWIRWIKATGTGNTGWVAGPEADTGWRDVSAALESGATGSLKVRRIGCNVTFTSFSLTSTTNGIWTVPSGFRPMDSGDDRSFPVAQNNGTAGAVGYGPAGINKIDLSAGMKAYGGVWLVWQWDSSDAWPSSLPGTAA